MGEEDDRMEAAPTKEQVAKYEMLAPMLLSALAEMREFSKKKQDGMVSKTKIKIINRLLQDIKVLLSGEPSIGYLELLDEQELPQNSDVVLILGQYHAAMNRFKKQHEGSFGNWVTKEYLEELQESENNEYEDEAHES